jgi:hypothetical protein
MRGGLRVEQRQARLESGHEYRMVKNLSSFLSSQIRKGNRRRRKAGSDWAVRLLGGERGLMEDCRRSTVDMDRRKLIGHARSKTGEHARLVNMLYRVRGGGSRNYPLCSEKLALDHGSQRALILLTLPQLVGG